jgi:purine-nucleoside phosphorylase
METTPEIIDEAQALEELTASLKKRDIGRARIALVLGSGLGGFADSLDKKCIIPYEEIDAMPRSAVPGHAGKLVTGEIDGVPVVVQQGRVHLYEGWSPAEVTRCVRSFARLGIGSLILTNAAGGLEADWEIPALMRITDHLNLQGRTPLIGTEGGFGCPYDQELGAAVDRAAAATGIDLHLGTYAGLLGPTYETPAEIRMLRWAGAQAVGMSTVAEACAAHAEGMKVAAISAITNPAAGITGEPLSHAEVVEAGHLVAERFCALIGRTVPEQK